MVEEITGRELTLEERIGVLRDVVPELLKCSSLFTRTNYDNKIQYFNLLKKQYIAVVLRLVTLGDGIRDVEKAMEPMFTTDKTGTRSGMGFSFMEAFMDQVHVESEPGKGTKVVMRKQIGR